MRLSVFIVCRTNSNLLSDYKPAADREPSCLPNLGVLTENGELLPIVSRNSCIPLMMTVLNKLCDNLHLMGIQETFKDPSLCEYIRHLEAAEWKFERSWYSRTELYLLTAMVKAAVLSNETLNIEITDNLWKITFKLVSALPADATHHVMKLLQSALGEKTRLAVTMNGIMKRLGSNLTIAKADPVNWVKVGLCNDVVSLYESYVSPNGDWSQAAMPKDWLFLPLVHMYTKCKNNVRLQPDDNKRFVTVLSLVYLSVLVEKLSPSLVFSRLVLVYLCDTVYLDEDVSSLLTKVMTDLLKRYHTRLDFKMELPGLSSFVDLFTAMCEHFCSTSYGDDGFAITLLVPVAQRHDTHYR